MKCPHLALASYGILLTLLVVGTLLSSACGSVWVSGCVNSTPVPQVTSVSPASIDHQSLPVTVTVTGSDFESWSKINWNSAPPSTTYIDSQHLSAVITPDMVSAKSGSGLIFVFTTGQSGAFVGCTNGGSSSTLTIIIN